MAADGTLLQGEVTQDPSSQERDVERLLLGFLRELVNEQGLDQKISSSLDHAGSRAGRLDRIVELTQPAARLTSVPAIATGIEASE